MDKSVELMINELETLIDGDGVSKVNDLFGRAKHVTTLFMKSMPILSLMADYGQSKSLAIYHDKIFRRFLDILNKIDKIQDTELQRIEEGLQNLGQKAKADLEIATEKVLNLVFEEPIEKKRKVFGIFLSETLKNIGDTSDYQFNEQEEFLIKCLAELGIGSLRLLAWIKTHHKEIYDLYDKSVRKNIEEIQSIILGELGESNWQTQQFDKFVEKRILEDFDGKLAVSYVEQLITLGLIKRRTGVSGGASGLSHLCVIFRQEMPELMKSLMQYLGDN